MQHQRAVIHVGILLAVIGIILTVVFGIVAWPRQPNEVPNLSVKVRREGVHVGRSQRIDEVVTIPITVFNNSHSMAYDIVLDLLFADGTGREGSLNEYLVGEGLPPIGVDRLAGLDEWNLAPQAISAPNQSRKIYASGKRQFRIKMQLVWKDDVGNAHRSISLATLRYAQPRESYGDAFWFENKKSYTSDDDPQKVNDLWGLPFGHPDR